MRNIKRIKNYFLDYIHDRGGIGVFLDFLAVASFCISIYQLNCFNLNLYAFIILALLIMLLITNISYFHYKSNSVLLKDLYYNNVPLISTMTYLIQTRGKSFSHTNDLTVRRVTIQYIFKKKEHEYFENNALQISEQDIVYTFHGSNDTNKTVYSFSMNFIQSIFANSRNSNFYAEYTINGLTKAERCELSVKRIGSLRKLVSIEFTGAGIQPQQEFTLKIYKNSIPATFRSVEHFLIDPAQYTNNQVIWKVELHSNSEKIQNQEVTLLELDRNTFKCKRIHFNRVKLGNFNSYCNTHYANLPGFYSKRNRVYLLRIEAPKTIENEAKPNDKVYASIK